MIMNFINRMLKKNMNFVNRTVKKNANFINWMLKKNKNFNWTLKMTWISSIRCWRYRKFYQSDAENIMNFVIHLLYCMTLIVPDLNSEILLKGNPAILFIFLIRNLTYFNSKPMPFWTKIFKSEPSMTKVFIFYYNYVIFKNLVQPDPK